MGTLTRADIIRLALSERLQLVEDIWDSIVECPEALPLTDEQKQELDRRLAAQLQNPQAGSPWDVVRDRIRHGR